MPEIEFVMQGPPVSLNARDGTPRSRKRYRDWVGAVKQAARIVYPAGSLPTGSNEVSVVITCYHTEEPPDVDNIIKPIFDGMNRVVYADDEQVMRVLSQRINRATETITGNSEVLVDALARFTEVVHIVVQWE